MIRMHVPVSCVTLLFSKTVVFFHVIILIQLYIFFYVNNSYFASLEMMSLCSGGISVGVALISVSFVSKT